LNNFILVSFSGIKIFKKFLQEVISDKFIEMLKIKPKLRTEEQIEFLKNHIQEKNKLEILIKNKTQDIDQNSILDCFSKNMEIQTAHKNEVLFHMGDNADKFFIILKGGVEISIPEKKKFWLSRCEYYKFLEKALYEEEIGIVNQILNSNYEKISFENYDDFYEFSKAKAKNSLIEKFKSITDRNSLVDFYQQNSIILKIFKIAYSLNDINFFSDQIYDLTLSEKKKYNISEKDEFNSESDDNNEEESQSEVKNLKSEENQEDPNRRVKYVRNNILMQNANKASASKLKKTIKIDNFDINELIPLINENYLTKTKNFNKKNKTNSYSCNNIINICEEKKKLELTDTPSKIPNNKNDLNFKTKENICQEFELTAKEQEILKKYSLMNTQAYKLEYNLIITNPLFLKEKDYFGDFALEDRNKKRTATVKSTENNTLLGFIKSKIYDEYIYSKNQKNNFENIQMLNDISIFKDMSLLNFQSFCYDRFEIKNFIKNKRLIDSNIESSEIFIIKEGKVDVTLNANIFDIQNIIDEILKIFPINNDNLTAEDRKLIKVLQSKNINQNSFNIRQKRNLMFKKNFSLFSLERSDILGLEPCFLKMKSFYKATSVSEKVSVYSLSEQNLNVIFTQFPDSLSSYDKFSHKKCMLLLSRLNEIRNAIMNLSNLKYNNVPINNYFEEQNLLKNKVSSSVDQLNNIKKNKYATTGNLPNIRLNIIDEDDKEYLKCNPSLEVIDHLNKKIIKRDTSYFQNKSYNQYSKLENISIVKDNSKIYNPNISNSNLKVDKKPEDFNKLLSGQQKYKSQISFFNKNIITQNSKKDGEADYKVVIKTNTQNNWRTGFKSNDSKYSKSTSNLPFIYQALITPIISDKIQNLKNSIKLPNDSIIEEENYFQGENENHLFEKNKKLKDLNQINQNNQSFNSSYFESTGSKFLKSTMNFDNSKINIFSNADKAKIKLLNTGEFIANNSNISVTQNNQDKNDIEENLFSYNQKIYNNNNRKISLDENSFYNNNNKNESNSFKFSKDKKQPSFRIAKFSSNLIDNNKSNSVNDNIQNGNLLSSDQGLNQFIKTNGNIKNFKKPDEKQFCNINVYNFSNIYNYGIGNSDIVKPSSQNKKMETVDNQNHKFSKKDYDFLNN